MQRRISIEVTAMAFGLVALTAGVFAQQAPAARGAAPQGQAAQGRGRGAAAADAATRPALLFKEEWKQPPYTGEFNDDNRHVTQDAVTNPQLELKLYGADAKHVDVYLHEGRHDLWTGMTTSPIAVTLRDKRNYMDLTGLARLRWMIRSSNLHAVYPVVKLADGTFLVGNPQGTDGQFIQTEVSFGNRRWFKLDSQKISTTAEVKTPDLSKVDEVGFADLMPGGGHGSAGWINVSAVELYAKAVPR